LDNPLVTYDVMHLPTVLATEGHCYVLLKYSKYFSVIRARVLSDSG